jgi:drug/metabolite transporter (DMT)-like permease
LPVRKGLKQRLTPVIKLDIPLKRLALILATGTCLGASTAVFQQAANCGLSLSLILAGSTLLGGMLLLPWIDAKGAELISNKLDWRLYLAFAGFLGIGFPYLILFNATAHLQSAVVAAILATPILATVMSQWILGRQALSTYRLLAVFVTVCGMFALALSKWLTDGHQSDQNFGWLVAGLLAACSLGYANYFRKAYEPEGATPTQLAVGILFAGGAICLAWWAAAFAMGRRAELPAEHNWGLMLGFVGVQGAIYAAQYWFQMQLQKAGDPTAVSLIGPVSAVIGVALGLWLFGQSVAWHGLVAVLLMIAGSVIVAVTSPPLPAPRSKDAGSSPVSTR